MIRRMRDFFASIATRPLKEQVTGAYQRLRELGGGGDPNAYLVAYRQLALQLSRSYPEQSSALIATPCRSAPVAQCCALLSTNMASIVRKPILLADISDEGRRMSTLLGLTSEMYSTADRRSRFFSVSGGWYVSTREGIPIGPYKTVEDARVGLSEFLEAPAWMKDVKAQDFSPQRTILPTYYQNLFFLPSEPARQALIRGAYLGKQQENVTGLLKDLYERFSYVIFYGGSIIDNPLLLSVTPYVNEVIHAVVENDTKTADVRLAQEALQACRTQQIPFVLIRPSRAGAMESGG
jgi:hypothetical protein